MTDRFATLLTQIFGILLPHPNQPQETILSLTGLEKLDDNLNDLKHRALKTFNLVLKPILVDFPDLKQQSPFVVKNFIILKGLVSTLENFGKRDDFMDGIGTEFIQGVVVESLRVLILSANDQIFYEYF